MRSVARGSGPADRLVAKDRRSFAETGSPPRPGAGARSEGAGLWATDATPLSRWHHEDCPVLPVALLKMHLHHLRARGRDVLAHKIRVDRKFSVSSINQHG